ncbi:hypothetical protein BDV28DRAFT_71785 [Aspergillus coremiiformis]|uniref:Uncharacterized protein n=1 Tax=Aspergillus coremiiformis TaxID=138285 RepID=A0A5N6YU09_9EURO|nr:hypothetical protein BDV28DRAFT_71785 [Aspergillus coremiiformis]
MGFFFVFFYLVSLWDIYVTFFFFLFVPSLMRFLLLHGIRRIRDILGMEYFQHFERSPSVTVTLACVCNLFCSRLRVNSQRCTVQK